MFRLLLLSIILAWVLLLGGKETTNGGKDESAKHSVEVTSSTAVNRTDTPLPTMDVSSVDKTPAPKPIHTEAPVLDPHEGEMDVDF